MTAHDLPLVYLAAPYSIPDPVENTHRAIRFASKIVDDGRVVPVVPHLTLFWHLVDPRPLAVWYALDLALLARCDALLRIPGPSIGADREVDFARARGLPVFDDVAALYTWADS